MGCRIAAGIADRAPAGANDCGRLRGFGAPGNGAEAASTDIAHRQLDPGRLIAIEFGLEVQAETAVADFDCIEYQRCAQRGAEFGIPVDRKPDVVAAIGGHAAIVELALVDETRRLQRCRGQQRQAQQCLAEP